MSAKFILGIVGGGFVGQAAKLFGSHLVKCKVYDIDINKCSKGVTSISDLSDCDLIFICVPTPMDKVTGECHTHIVEKCISNIREVIPNAEIVIRSTVPVGFSEKHKCHFIPEFLTEKNWEQDTYNCPEWFLGVDDNSKNVIQKIIKLFSNSGISYRTINSPPTPINFTVVSTKVAESIKYFRNCFLSTKVSFCNEFYRFCEANKVDYSLVSSSASRDTRIGTSHTTVPGHDGHFGFGGTCFPKDMASLKHQMSELNVDSSIISACIHRNETLDRPEKDWTGDTGRAVI